MSHQAGHRAGMTSPHRRPLLQPSISGIGQAVNTHLSYHRAPSIRARPLARSRMKTFLASGSDGMAFSRQQQHAMQTFFFWVARAPAPRIRASRCRFLADGDIIAAVSIRAGRAIAQRSCALPRRQGRLISFSVGGREDSSPARAQRALARARFPAYRRCRWTSRKTPLCAHVFFLSHSAPTPTFAPPFKRHKLFLILPSWRICSTFQPDFSSGDRWTTAFPPVGGG